MRRILPMLVLLFAATAYAQEETRITVPYERFVLPNGLNVILHEDHTTPTVSVNIWYHVGSGREKPGRTGFAHLFEHIMFEGSRHVPEGAFDEWLEAAGGSNNASTSQDRTNYYEDVPSNALELALFLDSDRMGYLLDAMSPETVDGQRDVVKNERRQRLENSPYGLAFPTMFENLFPPGHPYNWPVIGSMEDLSAASHDDVVEFFTRYYSPANASLAIAGDIDPEEARALVEKWFSDVPARAPVPPVDPPVAYLTEEKRPLLEDRVSLPRLYMAWLSPRLYAPGDAEMDVLASILTGGKNSRLYKRLVYDLQIAQDVSAFQYSLEHGSSFWIIATARAGHDLDELEEVIREELDRIRMEPPSEREVQRAINQYEAGFLRGLERVGGFGGKADRLNGYFVRTGNPDYFNEDLARYRAVDPIDIQAVAQTYLRDDGRVALSVVPEGQLELAASGAGAKAE
ncbi:MAG: insulinase family protein [Gemmatimonadota bacterium]|nr:MAG: insulinase family protein [Gemmatimonadota bacterium]